jgi:hypothetical protein
MDRILLQNAEGGYLDALSVIIYLSRRTVLTILYRELLHGSVMFQLRTHFVFTSRRLHES